MSWTTLIHWSAQAMLLVVAVGVTLHLASVRDPRLRLWTLQLTLLACGLLPLYKPELFSISVSLDGVVATSPITRTRLAPVISLPVIWAIGASVMLLRMLLALVQVARLRGISTAFARRGDVEIRVSGGVASPVTFGFLHPVILLPPSAVAISAEVREPMIAHELEHIRRKDWLMVLAEELCRVAAWFHPAIWWLLSQIRTAREHVIDAHVAQSAGSDTYAESLLTAAQWRASLKETQPFPAVAMHGGGSLEERLQRILYPKENSMTRFHRAAAVTALAFSTLTMMAVSTSAFPLFAEEKVNPKIIKKTTPAYPPLAKAAKVQGTVVLQVRIGTDGSVGNIEVVSGHPLLVPAAIDAVSQWEFEPGRKNGTPVQVDTTVEINFTLADN